MRWFDETTKTISKNQKSLFYPGQIWLFLFLIFFPVLLFAQQKLSEQAKISVLTCGAGDEVYSTFGHTAIWVYDPQNSIDEVYNYGIFDFRTKNFYLKFLSGKLDYYVLHTTFANFMWEYRADNRWVKEQELLVSDEIKLQIYDALKKGERPENRYYRYDFFRNNCSTKIIDLILASSNNQAALDTLNKPSGKTFREGLKPHIENRSWLYFGIYLLLGPFSDQDMSRLQSCYIPEDLMHQLEASGLATSPQLVFEGIDRQNEVNRLNVPSIIFWLLLFLLVAEALWFKTSQGISDRIDVVLFSISALLGVLFVVLWIGSDHVSLQVNLNLIWANPFNFILIWSILKHKQKFTRIYLVFYGLCLFFLLINWSKLPQTFPMELMPIVSALVFRAVNRVFNFRQKDEILAKKTAVFDDEDS